MSRLPPHSPIVWVEPKDEPTRLGDEVTAEPFPGDQWIDPSKPFGSGDTTFHKDFLTGEESSRAFEALSSSIQWQQWHHMPDKKKKCLKPLSRVKVSMADEIVDEDGETWIPHYRFPVNNQSAHTIFSIQENPSIQMIVDRASKHTSVDFNHVVVLLYRDGSDCIGAHKDKLTDLDPEAPICSVSLGAERPYVLRISPFPAQSTTNQKLILKHGGLLVLGPKTNKEFYHTVPKLEEACGPRISITMRKVTTFRNVKSGILKGQGEAYDTHDWPTELRGSHVPYDGYKEILNFWFGFTSLNGTSPDVPNYQWRGSLWWHGNAPEYGLNTMEETDAYIADKWSYLLAFFTKPDINLFGDDHVLHPWLESPEGMMGALILFDQFPRHIFRYEAKAFAFDHYALELAQRLTLEFGDCLSITEKVFILTTFMHQEDEFFVGDASLKLMTLSEEVEDKVLKKELRKMSKVAEDHLKMLSRFGRYCHRNYALGRESTEEEVAYLGGKYLPKWVRSVLPDEGIPNIPKVETPIGIKLKLLVLHSNRQNAEGFQRKTRNSLERRLSSIADLHYFNAPHPYTPSGEAKETLDVLEVPTSSGIYCWWNASDDPETMVYSGLEESVAFVNGLFKTHDFDGIIGFSQGGTLAGFLSLLVDRARKGLECPFDVSSFASKLKFVVCISGFPVRDVGFREMIGEASIDIPSFHSWGLEDTLVDPWRSEALSKMFVNPRIIVHKSSHFRRAIKYWPVDQIAKWAEGFMDQSSSSISFADLAVEMMGDDEALEKFLSSSPHLLPGLLRYLVTCGLYPADAVLKFLAEIYADPLEQLINLCEKDVHFWSSIIDLNKVEPREAFQTALADVIASILVEEYKTFVIGGSPGLPSTLALYSPRYKKSRFNPQREFANLIAFGIAEKINTFNPEEDSIERSSFDSNGGAREFDSNGGAREFDSDLAFKKAVYTQYTRMLGALNSLRPSPPASVPRKHRKREPLEVLLAKPLSDYILNPKAEPIEGAPREAFEPLYTYLTSHEADRPSADLGFPQGTVCADGRLDLCKHPMDCGYGITDLMKALESDSADPTPKVSHLLLGNNCYGNELGKAVGSFIASGRSALTSWYIAGNDLTREGIEPVCEALMFDVQVLQLWLKRNPLHRDGVQPICDLLRTNSYLQTLDLTNTGLLDPGAIDVLLALGSNSTLRHLYLGMNGLTADTCRVFTSIEHNLSHLSISGNRVGDEGAMEMAKVLTKSTTLKILDISSCGIGPKGAQAIADALKTNTSLGKLNIGFLKATNDVGEVPNRIENEGVEAFASVLKTSTTLRILDFTYNGIQQRGIASLAKAIIENTSLCYCNLEQVGVPHNEFSRELIRKIVKRNYLSLDGDAKKEVDDLLSPPHLDEILSVYRIA